LGEREHENGGWVWKDGTGGQVLLVRDGMPLEKLLLPFHQEFTDLNWMTSLHQWQEDGSEDRR